MLNLNVEVVDAPKFEGNFVSVRQLTLDNIFNECLVRTVCCKVLKNGRRLGFVESRGTYKDH